jgi:hypothetical protein
MIRKMFKWILCEKQMPPAYTDVLTVTNTGEMTIGTAHPNGEWSNWELENTWDITHWMPLPEAPKLIRK